MSVVSTRDTASSITSVVGLKASLSAAGKMKDATCIAQLQAEMETFLIF